MAMAQITINGVSIDPDKDGPTLLARSLLSADSSHSDYILVQMTGPLLAAQRAELVKVGVEPLEYVPENTYLCRYRPASLEAVRKLPFVGWANTYMKGFKIAPVLHAAIPGTRSSLLDVGPLAGGVTKDLPLVDVVLHRKVDPVLAAPKIAQAAGLDPSDVAPQGGKFRIRASGQRLEALASLEEVRHIEPVRSKKLFNNVAIKIMTADVVHRRAELQGEGEVIAVCDTGFDLGSTTDVHPAFKNRVAKIYALGRAKGSDPNGHGTHVCGSAVGDDNSALLGGPIRGTAPRAKLVVQSVLDGQGGLGGLPANLTQLFTPPYQNDGARVHSNSWGDSQNAYTEEAREVDEFVWNHRDAVILFAAGNDGSDANANGLIDAGSIGSPATAKNCITVGASENLRVDFEYRDGATHIPTYGDGWPQDYPAEPIASDRLADDPDGLAAFSSRGPTSDGRIKPDVVAPGTAILSTRSRAPGVGNGWGPTDDPGYFYEGGTSMATPLVAGCAAVVRQYLKKKGVTPSAALVKAMLINAAHNQSGQHPNESGTIPNVHEGFGRVDLAATVGVEIDGLILQHWDEARQLDTGEEQTFEILLPAHARRIKVTLVWTDPPGETLQNDLDLTVTTQRGTERHGNMGTSKKFDRRNNVEQVVMTAVDAGKVKITVRAHRIAITPQSFALVFRALC
jgi:serine protease AprX